MRQSDHILFFWVFFILALPSYAVESQPIRSSTIHVIAPKQAVQVDGEAVMEMAVPEPGQTLQGSIERKPSVQVRSSGTETVPEFTLRGQPAHQNRVFLEGVPLNGFQFNRSQLNYLAWGSMGQADIYPAVVPRSLLSDGTGGALNFHFIPPQKASGQLTLGSGGSLNLSRQFPINSNLAATLEFRGARRNFVYFDDNGTPFNLNDDAVRRRENNAFERGVLLLHRRDKRSQVFALASLGRVEVPGAIGESYQGEIQDGFLLLSGRYQWDSFQAQIFGNYGIEDSKVTGLAVGPPSQSKNLLLGVHLKPKLAGLELEWAPQYQSYQANYVRKEVRTSRLLVPVGVGAKYRFGKWLVSPAVVGFMSHSASPDRLVTDFVASPRVGVFHYLTPQNRLRVNIAKLARFPSLHELFGSPNGLSANPGLVSESGYKLEVGADRSTQTFQASLTSSLSLLTNKIQLIQNSQSTFVSANVGRSLIWWNEAAVAYRPVSKFRFEASGSWNFSENQSEISYEKGKRLPSIPSYELRTNVRYGSRRWLQLGIQREGVGYWDLANEKKFFPKWVAGFAAGMVGRFGELTLDVENIFDVYSAPSEFSTSGYQFTDNTTGLPGFPEPGRKVSVTWKKSI